MQLFSRSSNFVFRLVLVSIMIIIGGGLFLIWFFSQSSYQTGVAVATTQPVPFSHQHHVGELGIDCQYCHTSIEDSAYAGMPSTEICMNCHNQIWSDSELLKPVRDSFKNNEPLKWNQIYFLPDFVYFDHSAHTSHQITCSKCHGDVSNMPFVVQKNPMTMQWCINCHLLKISEKKAPEDIVDCNTCHR